MMHRVTLCVRCPPPAQHPTAWQGEVSGLTSACWCDTPFPFSQAFLSCVGVCVTQAYSKYTVCKLTGGQQPGVTLVREGLLQTLAMHPKIRAVVVHLCFFVCVSEKQTPPSPIHAP